MISARNKDEIVRFYTVTDPTTHKKGYTVYKVTARIISRKNPEDIQEITVWKRYSDFKKLHQDLWQIHRNLFGQSELFPPFAKAKVFGRFDDSVIEKRRQCSEDLLQFSANIPALYGSQYLQDFFKGGEVQDSSELIGPAEPFSDFLADSVLDSSSEGKFFIKVFVDDLLVANPSEHERGSGYSELNSLEVDGDSLAAVGDGMASGSIKHSATQSNSSPIPQPVTSPSRVGVESSHTSGNLSFASSLRNSTEKEDYLEKASELIALAVQKEVEQEFAVAFSYYRRGVDLLLQGVQGEASPSRREAVKRKTAEYLMRAELISAQLKDSMGQSSTQSRALGSQCCGGSWSEQTYTDELKHYRVLGVIDKVLLVMDKRTQETFILKGLRKSSACGRVKKTVVPRSVPNMVQLEKYIISEDSIFLLLEYAEGGKLWTHICKYLHGSSPDESFNIPFIQKTHSSAIHSTLNPVPTCSSSVDSRGLSIGERPLEAQLPDSGATSEEECTNSYLTLCNEYEQEKLEPEEDHCTLIPVETEKHTCSGLNTDSLCSPISMQELCFFTEEDQLAGFMDQCTCSPDHLNQSPPKEELSYSDSQDVCKPLLVPQDAGIEVTEEPLENLQEVSDLWRSDSDQCSNELVPVISFKEAVLEDANVSCAVEGQPPDLLVNLPTLDGGTVDVLEEELTAGGSAFTVVTTTSPTFGRPDVLQRGEKAELDLSVDVSTLPLLHKPSKMPFKADFLSLSSPKLSGMVDTSVSRTQKNFVEHEDVELGTEGTSGEQEVEKVSKLFQELDKLAAVSLDTHIPEALVRSWAADMVVALDALHQEGIICRDLNPYSIVIGDTGRVQLTYFCSWSDVEESCDPNAFSKMYCAPEVGGICEETLACDWWSLGALLFELIVGKSLYQCHPAGIGRHSSLNIPEFVSEEARSLLEQLLQYNPVERLGAGVGGVEDIKSHPFFSHVNWTN
ncbi:LOW QUALITY PROTEIN: ribosomal protein S6 kinase delta-1 [Megalobrama amblycephala]|uniref:LOW QUALITY PROTEIN: ribosomal protein S6 kinase delta-1 n=1 Tax=Megalobrama amblycephala TaxID=75352 RepID=UPI002013E4F2|nr:LOW QUALITY PROTEIN: ribosomal protein S6 kinase delta-1 [Megalobrama amblycephala]